MSRTQLQAELEKAGATCGGQVTEGSIAAQMKVLEPLLDLQNVFQWEAAIKTWLNISDWPGGESNRSIMRGVLNHLDLLDAEDKVAALEWSYAYMKAHNLVQAHD